LTPSLGSTTLLTSSIFPVPAATYCPAPLASHLRPRPARPTLFPYTTLFRSPLLPRKRAGSGGPHTVHHQFVHSQGRPARGDHPRSEEHTSELQSRENLVCRLLLEKKNTREPDRQR